MSDPTLSAAVAALAQAEADYADAYKASESARGETTRCLNRLNEMQKAVDTAYAALRQDSARESDWKRQSHAAGREYAKEST